LCFLFFAFFPVFVTVLRIRDVDHPGPPQHVDRDSLQVCQRSVGRIEFLSRPDRHIRFNDDSAQSGAVSIAMSILTIESLEYNTLREEESGVL
jgi:hypothetical protein